MRLAVSGQMARERQRSGRWKGVRCGGGVRTRMLPRGRAGNVADVAGIGGRRPRRASVRLDTRQRIETRGEDARGREPNGSTRGVPEREGPARRFAC